MLKTLFLLLFCLSSVLVAENITWVDSYRGQAEAQGTELQPYNSIQKAIEKNKDGHLVQVIAGNYSENLTIEKSVSIKVTNGAVVLTGGAKVDIDYQQENLFHSPETIAIGPNFVLRENDNVTIVSGHSIQILTDIEIPKGASLRLVVDPDYPVLPTSQTRQKAKPLTVGESAVVKVEAKEYWGKTGIYLEKGATYSFAAHGKWVDWYIESSANGFEKDFMKLFEPLRRAPKQKWFSLMGSVNEERLFLLGEKATITIAESGELLCFANDVRFFYWNNKGSLELTITKIASAKTKGNGNNE